MTNRRPELVAIYDPTIAAISVIMLLPLILAAAKVCGNNRNGMPAKGCLNADINVDKIKDSVLGN